MNEALVLDKVTRGFVQGGERLEVLTGASLTVRSGEIVALVGPSGAGKSTLLHIAGLLERPDGGAVQIGGEDAGNLSRGCPPLLGRSRRTRHH
ncbi:MAG: ATP-binding cassette domain-containing protein, partial [Alphaproteobacteria bacterium]|nr:ATP-binding cassette domain-containing protein [Alphaproteobacteria bacterium]